MLPGMKKVLSSVSLALDGLAGDRFLLALLDDLGSIPACPRSSGSGSLLSSCLLLLFSLGQSKMSDQHPSILILERKKQKNYQNCYLVEKIISLCCLSKQMYLRAD